MDYILSGKNKGFLWNILYEKNIFNGIPDDNLDKIQNIFESVVQNVSQNTTNDNILEINKEILKDLNTKIKKFKYDLLESKNVKDEFRDEKILVFDKNLQDHKDSLNNLMIINKPKEINFADDSDKPLDNIEMNKILEQMQKERYIDSNITSNIERNNIEVKISDEKIIKEDNIMGDSKNDDVPKLKIESIEELLKTEIITLDEPFNRPLDKQVEKLKKDDSKFKNINKILEDEYKEENKLNSNFKLENITKLLNKILLNQERIMNKLEII